MAWRRLELRADEAGELRLRAEAMPARERRRSEIILLSAEGLTQQIADRMGQPSTLRIVIWP